MTMVVEAHERVGLSRDAQGRIHLECTCGLVISGNAALTSLVTIQTTVESANIG